MTSLKNTAQLEIVRASPDQQPVLANLFQLYAHDFSEFHDVELGRDGRFIYNDLPRYWLDPNRHAFLIMADGQLAGFVLLRRGSDVSANENVWDMVEFFIVRGLRRRGLGTEVARRVWEEFPGIWEVRVLDKNSGARQFWERAIAKFVGRKIAPRSFEKDEDSWQLFGFESQGHTHRALTTE